jgi:hypothetical protein
MSENRGKPEKSSRGLLPVALIMAKTCLEKSARIGRAQGGAGFMIRDNASRGPGNGGSCPRL